MVLTGTDLSAITSAVAVLLASLVGILSFRANQRAEKTREVIGGTTAAISGLEVLATRHALEIERLDQRNSECEKNRVELLERIAKLDGQIDVLKSLTSTAAAEVVRVAAKEAKEVVATAATEAAKIASPE